MITSSSNCIEIYNLTKKYKDFTLDIPGLNIPEGFATALIGENGAGKSTLLNILSGIRLDYKGSIKFFDKYTDVDREKESCPVKERIGYTGTQYYYMPGWTIGQVGEISELLFDGFHKDRWEQLITEMEICQHKDIPKKKVSELSDGNRTKLMLSGVLARDTDMLILDEPASALDPLMRMNLCDRIRSYLEEGDGKRSVFFSTHDVADMESVTDYAIIMAHGSVVESGSVEELKDKYVLIKGEADDADALMNYMVAGNRSDYGFEGICLAGDVDKLTGYKVSMEVPTLTQISVAVMQASKMHTTLGKE